jgi:CheY-like chemotaxis protein
MATVLVVDDDDGIRMALALVLEDEGYGVLDAANGHAALHALRASPQPLIVLLDRMMPVMSGDQVLVAIEQDVALQRHAYILLTAAAIKPALRQILDRFAIPLVRKPFDVVDLLEVIATVAERLAKSGARQESGAE